MKAVIITGLSGSGKSGVVKTLEDIGYYCVDNLPVALVRTFVELSETHGGEIQKLAMVVDARDQRHINQLPKTIQELSAEGHIFELVFLTASDAVLSRRFKETRRRHPISPDGSVKQGIKKERAILEPLVELANEVWDTSDFSPSDLRKHVFKAFSKERKAQNLSVQVLSFGFKYGLPANADVVFDVRFLTNPFFKEKLKHKRGTDKPVQKFVLEQEDSNGFLSHMGDMLSFLLPRYDREGKSYLVIAIGCTGGKHRSVVMAQEVFSIVKEKGYVVTLNHRDIERE